MKCDRCGEDKNAWTELFPMSKSDHMRNNAKKWLLCKPCYETQVPYLHNNKLHFIRGKK